MYAVITACGTYPSDVTDYPRTRRWGEPKLRFIAQTFEEVAAWWKEQMAAESWVNALRDYDYVIVLTPDGVRNLLNEPMKEHPDTGWVQMRLGAYLRPETDADTPVEDR